MPVDAPAAWMMRAAISAPIDEAAMAANDATTDSASPTSTTGRRPKRSDSGPSTSWAQARLSRYKDKVSCTVPASVPSRVIMPGSAGTTMLSVAGPMAVIAISSGSRRHGLAVWISREECMAYSGRVAASSHVCVAASMSGRSASRTRA